MATNITKEKLKAAVEQLNSQLEGDLNFSVALHKHKDDFTKYTNPDNDNGFKKFLGKFSIGRNLKKDVRHEEVVETILKNVDIENKNTTNEIAELLQNKKLSSTTSKDKNKHILPLSLVSKMLFLYRPDIYIPYDDFAFLAIKSLGYKVKARKSMIT